MIDPVLFTINLGFTVLQIRWYGLLAVSGILTAITLGRWVVKQRGRHPDLVSDAFIFILLAGILGARLWYVFADIIGGDSIYVADPTKIWKIWEGGLNILGGIIFGVVTGLIYARRKKVEFFLLSDAFCPGYLMGQAIGRIGNYINQELYGPPTTLPWGIKIMEQHRIGPWRDMTAFPEATTLFHPSFAYQMIWNIAFALLLIYIIRKTRKKMAYGVISGLTLIIIGIGRAVLESGLRPDQPKFFGLPITTSMLLSIVFALIGLFIVLLKLEIIKKPEFNNVEAMEVNDEPKVNKGSHRSKSKKRKK